MSNYCIMRIEKIKSLKQMQAAYNHNYRMQMSPNVNPELSINNEELIPIHGNTYEDVFNIYTSEHGYGTEKTFRKNAVLLLEVVLTFSRDAKDSIDLEAWKESNLTWLRGQFNARPLECGDNLLSCVFHKDEVGNEFHLHSVICPIDPNNNLNASYYIDGPAKLRVLQDSYAEAMAVHGLERPIKYSSATHTDLKRFYGELNRTLDLSAPKWSKDDTPITYQEKVKEDIKDRAAVYFRKEKEHESELRKLKDIHANEKKDLERQLDNAKRNIYRYKQKQEELERELGPINIVKKTMEVVRLLRTGLEDMPSDTANAFTEQMNLIIVNQRHKEREKAEEEKKRKKSIFEKIQ